MADKSYHGKLEGKKKKRESRLETEELQRPEQRLFCIGRVTSVGKHRVQGWGSTAFPFLPGCAPSTTGPLVQRSPAHSCHSSELKVHGKARRKPGGWLYSQVSCHIFPQAKLRALAVRSMEVQSQRPELNFVILTGFPPGVYVMRSFVTQYWE